VVDGEEEENWEHGQCDPDRQRNEDHVDEAGRGDRGRYGGLWPLVPVSMLAMNGMTEYREDLTKPSVRLLPHSMMISRFPIFDLPLALELLEDRCAQM
jgi:hypothetical protein